MRLMLRSVLCSWAAIVKLCDWSGINLIKLLHTHDTTRHAAVGKVCKNICVAILLLQSPDGRRGAECRLQRLDCNNMCVCVFVLSMSGYFQFCAGGERHFVVSLVLWCECVHMEKRFNERRHLCICRCVHRTRFYINDDVDADIGKTWLVAVLRNWLDSVYVYTMCTYAPAVVSP